METIFGLGPMAWLCIKQLPVFLWNSLSCQNNHKEYGVALYSGSKRNLQQPQNCSMAFHCSGFRSCPSLSPLQISILPSQQFSLVKPLWELQLYVGNNCPSNNNLLATVNTLNKWNFPKLLVEKSWLLMGITNGQSAVALGSGLQASGDACGWPLWETQDCEKHRPLAQSNRALPMSLHGTS